MMHAKCWMNNMAGRHVLEEGEVDMRSQECGRNKKYIPDFEDS
jgi:hypothetical protein